MAMQVLTQAIYNQMANDNTGAGNLVSQLSTYSGGPAIFMYAPVPGAATRPFVVCANSIVDKPFDTKQTTGREETRIIGCYDVSTVSYDIVEAIAERVRFLFHHVMLPVTGYTMILAEASGPIIAPADDQMTDYVRMVTPSTPVLAPFGLLVTVRWIIN
jgi:hypothetical protein